LGRRCRRHVSTNGRENGTPANLAAVRKLLDERGLLAADEFDSRLPKALA
jgi:hypothetical protein